MEMFPGNREVGGLVGFGVKSDRVAATGGDAGDEGTVMVDALVAVVIISLMIAMCTTAIGIAAHAWRHARETRQAQITLAALIAITPRTAGKYSGTRDGFRYTVDVAEQKTQLSRYCTLHAQVSASRSYGLDAARWCDAKGAVG